MPVQLNSEPSPIVHIEGRQETPVGESCISFFIWYAQENKLRYGIIRQTEFPFGKPHHHWYMPSEPHGEGDIAVELWKKLEPGEK